MSRYGALLIAGQIGLAAFPEFHVSAAVDKIAIDQSIEEVTAALGQPEKIIVLGSKTIYFYPAVRVHFQSGKVDRFEPVKPAAGATPPLVLSPLVSIGHAPKAVLRVEIYSSSSGHLSRRHETEIAISREGNGYQMRSILAGDAHDGDPSVAVDAALIESLVKALDAPFRAEPSLESLGITPEWLTANAHAIAQEASSTSATYVNGDGQGIFITAHDIESILADPIAMKTVVQNLCKRSPIDAHGQVELLIQYEDGTSDLLSTRSLSPMMLPWIVQSGGKAARTYDGAISRAVAGLMPQSAVNREILSGSHLGQTVAQPVVLDLIARARDGNAASHLDEATQRERWRSAVLAAMIARRIAALPNRSIHDDGRVIAELSNSAFIGNLRETATLTRKNGEFPNVEAFLQSATRFETLVRSVPWLNAYMQENTQVPFGLSLTDYVSLDEQSLGEFEQDMAAIGKASLASRVEAQKDDIALLSGPASSRWLIFPDGRMILWKYNVRTPTKSVLRWPISDLPSTACAGTSKHRVDAVACAGQEISPSGELQPAP